MKTLAKQNTGRCRRAAFTLTELLVVIAIVAILAAVLMPVLSTVRANASSTKCVSNLHQIGAGMARFVSDHDGYLPGPLASGVQAYYFKADLDGVSLGANKRLAVLLQAYVARPLQSGGNFLNPVFVCPAAKRALGLDLNPAKPPKDEPIFYLLNNSVSDTAAHGILPFGHASKEAEDQAAPKRLATLASRISRNLSDVWMIKDFDYDIKGASRYPGSPEHPVHPTYKSFDHGGATGALKAHPGSYRNTLFFDFHVARLTLDDKPL